MFVSIETGVQDLDFLSSRKISATLSRDLMALQASIEALDADSILRGRGMGTYEDRQWQRTQIFWSVFLMGLAGFI